MRLGAPFRTGIPPVDPREPRPFWSVMIPTYNCAGFLRTTLAAVLAQDLGPDLMQIEVVDDHSTGDDPEAVVRELGQGRVGFHRQPRNVGHVANFNSCILRSRGHLVHILHGDDLIEPGFYRAMSELFAAEPSAAAAWCRYRVIDESGRQTYHPPAEQPHAGLLPDALERIARHQPIQTPAVVVHRYVYEEIGGFDRRMRYCGEDWEMWVRIAARYPIAYEPRTLAVYRSHSVSLTGRSLATGQNVRDLSRAISIYRTYLPLDQLDWTHTARIKTAHWSLSLARRLAATGRVRATLAQLWQAFRIAVGWRERLNVLRVAGWAVTFAPRRAFRHRRRGPAT